MEVGDESDYISSQCRYTVTSDFGIKVSSDESHHVLMFHNCEGQNHKTVSTDHNF